MTVLSLDPLQKWPRVFVSYARDDGEAFATALRKRPERDEPEITLWQDRAEMKGGVGWRVQLVTLTVRRLKSGAFKSAALAACMPRRLPRAFRNMTGSTGCRSSTRKPSASTLRILI